MTSKLNQSKSTVHGDQVGGDKVTNNLNVAIEKKLSLATSPIRVLDNDSDIADHNNTVLIRKLRAGEFNKPLVDHAIRSKAEYLKKQIEFRQTEQGRVLLRDVQANLLMLINDRYVSKMNEGDTLRTNLSEMIHEFSAIVIKYKDILTIDEAFVEGMLYAVTSECAINWRIEGFDDES